MEQQWLARFIPWKSASAILAPVTKIYAGVAQSAEHPTCNRKVKDSTSFSSSLKLCHSKNYCAKVIRGCLKSLKIYMRPLSKPLPEAGRGFKSLFSWKGLGVRFLVNIDTFQTSSKGNIKEVFKINGCNNGD